MMIHLRCLAALCACLAVSHGLSVLVGNPDTVQRGQTTTLPCWLNPSESAEGLEVRWYRHDAFDKPIILYRAKKLDASHQAAYADRVSFGLKDAVSAGLTAGDVSLRLVNVTTADAGNYTCYVSSDQGYDSTTVTLRVTETGTSPFLSVVWREDNTVNVSCESEGWFPQPRLRWSGRKQVLTPQGLKYSSVSSGLVSVHSWLLLSDSFELSCSVDLPDGKAKEATIRLEKPAQREVGSSLVGWVAVLATLLIAVLVAFGLLFFKNRALFLGKKDKSEETKPLLPQRNFEEVTKHYVNIDFEETGNPHIKIKDRLLRDVNNVNSPEEVTCLTAVRGKPGFSSGQHYWEVSLKKQNVEVKKSWWIGITNATDFPLQGDVTPTASHGFLFLSSSTDSFQFSTKPIISLPVHSRPQTVGVYLDYDSGQLSFYDVEKQCIIGSVAAKFTGEVFPIFNPGSNDPSPMEILHKSMQDECRDEGEP